MQKNIAAYYWNYLNVIRSQVNYLILKGNSGIISEWVKIGLGSVWNYFITFQFSAEMEI